MSSSIERIEDEFNFINFMAKNSSLNALNKKYDDEEIKDKIKKIIEKKIDYYNQEKINGIVKIYDKEIEDLLELQENLFIQNEIIKQKILVLKNHLESKINQQ